MVPKNERFPIQTVDADFANADKIIALALTTYQFLNISTTSFRKKRMENAETKSNL